MTTIGFLLCIFGCCIMLIGISINNKDQRGKKDRWEEKLKLFEDAQPYAKKSQQLYDEAIEIGEELIKKSKNLNYYNSNYILIHKREQLIKEAKKEWTLYKQKIAIYENFKITSNAN